MDNLAQQASDLNTVASFLAAPDVIEPMPASLDEAMGAPRVDLLVLLGNGVLATVDAAARAFQQGVAPELMVVGGTGHSTMHLRTAVRNDPRHDGFPLDDAPEAAILQNLLVRWYGIDDRHITVEPTSTNCGGNAEETFRLLRAQSRAPSDILLMQDPTMQRRSWASFRRVWEGHDDFRFVNGPPFVPAVRAQNGELTFETPAESTPWPMERFIALVMGEIPRLRNDEHGYGPKGRGFIVAVDIPPAVASAYDRLLSSFGDAVRWPPE